MHELLKFISRHEMNCTYSYSYLDLSCVLLRTLLCYTSIYFNFWLCKLLPEVFFLFIKSEHFQQFVRWHILITAYLMAYFNDNYEVCIIPETSSCLIIFPVPLFFLVKFRIFNCSAMAKGFQ